MVLVVDASLSVCGCERTLSHRFFQGNGVRGNVTRRRHDCDVKFTLPVTEVNPEKRKHQSEVGAVAHIITNSVGFWTSFVPSKMVFLQMWWSPLKAAVCTRHATFSTTVPLTPHVAPAELTRSNRNALVVRSWAQLQFR